MPCKKSSPFLEEPVMSYRRTRYRYRARGHCERCARRSEAERGPAPPLPPLFIGEMGLKKLPLLYRNFSMAPAP